MPRLSSATETSHPSNSALYSNDVNSSAVLVTPVSSRVFRHWGLLLKSVSQFKAADLVMMTRCCLMTFAIDILCRDNKAEGL
jgi:hypothetical protein